MQPSTDAIAAIVFDAVDDLNKQLPRNKRLDKSPGTRLAGPGGQLDSLGLVNLMVNTEQKLETALGLEVMLAEEAAGATDEHARDGADCSLPLS